MTCGFRDNDAAYVLGSLPPVERQRYAQHLGECEECSRSVRELAGMPGLLARLEPDVAENGLDSAVPVPDTLLPALVAQVRRSQARRTGVFATAAAAAAAVAAVTTATLASDNVTDPQVVDGRPAASAATGPDRPMTPVGQRLLSARVGFDAVAWGTRLRLVCTYRADNRYSRFERPPAYVLVVRTRSGRTETVATWRAVPGETMRLTAATALARAEIASVEVRTVAGRPVLRLAA